MAKGAKKPGRSKPAAASKVTPKKGIKGGGKKRSKRAARPLVPIPAQTGADVLDRLWDVVMDRRGADPGVSHSARLLSRGTAKVAQKFGEEAVECLIEAVAGNREALISESADVLYHLIVVWVNAGIRADEVWHELQMREGISGIAEKASRARSISNALGLNTTKIP